MTRKKLTRFTVEIFDRYSKQIIKAALDSGVQSVDIRQGRVVQLHEKRQRVTLPVPMQRAPSLLESPGEVINFLAEPDRELEVMHRLVHEARLDVSGRGTVYTEPVEAVGSEADRFRQERGTALPAVSSVPDGILSGLSGMVFIVPKGLGNAVSSTALELGTCVPVVTLGTGTGLRDKIGLLRITIPAEKELVTLVTPRHDAEGIAALIIEELRLNQPGKGFVYTYPVGSGLLNTKLRIGPQKHAATIEQIIAAIDGLRYGTDWRTRFSGDERSLPGGSRFLRGLMVLSIICNEEWTFRLTRAAMAAGSGGATSTRVRSVGPAVETEAINPVQEITTMIVREELVDPIIDAVVKQGLFDRECSGTIEIGSCPFAYAYSGSKRKPS